MFCTSTKFYVWLAATLLVVSVTKGQTIPAQIDPTTQIAWPLVTGSGAPVGTCSAVNKGEPYDDVTNNNAYFCGGAAWQEIAGAAGSVSSVFGRSGAVLAVGTDYSSFYLGLSGGTLTGTLNGTTINASALMSAPTINATTGFQVGGAALATSNLADWTDSGVANGNCPVWNSTTSKWTPGSCTGTSAVTSFSAPSAYWPTWLVPSVTNSTTTPVLTVTASAIPNSSLAVQTANTIMGALAATYPSGLPMPVCSGSSNALTWTDGTGFGCNSLSTGTVTTTGSPVSGNIAAFSSGTSITNATSPQIATALSVTPSPVTVSTLNATTFRSVLDATQFAGADIGAKVNAAIASCSNSCEVDIPAGVYSYATSINIPITTNGKITLKLLPGAVITYTGSSYGINTVETGLVGSNPGILITGGALIGTSSGLGGVHLLPTDDIHVEDMSITGFSAGVGVLNEGAEVTRLTGNFIQNNLVGVELITTLCETASPYSCSPSYVGGAGYTSYASNAMHAIGNVIAANSGHNVFDEATTVGGVYRAGSNNQFVANDLEGGSGTALEIDSTNDTVSGNYFEATPHFVVLGNLGISATGTQIKGNHFTTPTSAHYTIEEASGTSNNISGNYESGASGNTCFINYGTSNYDYSVGNTLTSTNQFCHSGSPSATLPNAIYQTNATGTLNVSSLTATTSITTPSLTATTSVTTPLLNNTVSSCSFPGSTADVQIANAFASLPSSQGTVDARCYGTTTQTLAATVPLLNGQILKFSPSTKIVPASASSNVVNMANGSALYGLNVSLGTYASSYTGAAVSQTCNGTVTIHNLQVQGTAAPGSAIALSCAVANGSIGFDDIDGVFSQGLLTPIQLVTSASGAWINGNIFKNLILVTGANSACITLTNNGLEERGNFFEGSCEASSGASSVGVSLGGTGTSPIQSNQFKFDIWDTTTNWDVVSGTVKNNWLIGNIDGTTSDNGLNSINSLTANVFKTNEISTFNTVYSPEYRFIPDLGAGITIDTGSSKLTLVDTTYGGQFVNKAYNSVLASWTDAGVFSFPFGLSASTLTATTSVTTPLLNGVSTANVHIVLPTASIAANTCTTPATVAISGLLTTSTFTTAFASNPNSVNGWGANGGLVLTAWPTAGTLNWSLCNQTSAAITPGAMTLNVGAH